jgi:ribosomal protein L37AE/L43A
MSDEEFREKFLYLKQVYDNYTEKIEALEKKTQLYSRVFGMAPLSLGGVVVSGISLYFRNLYIVALGGLIAILGLILGGQISSKLSAKIKKEVKQLQEEFRQDYFCPDCANELGTHNSWNYLKNKGKCPYCKREWNV